MSDVKALSGVQGFVQITIFKFKKIIKYFLRKNINTCQFHQHFKRIFCTNISVQKSTSLKRKYKKSCALNAGEFYSRFSRSLAVLEKTVILRIGKVRCVSTFCGS